MYRRNRCNTKRLNAAGKWIGGRGQSTGLGGWGGIGVGRFYKNQYHRALRRVAKDYCRFYEGMEIEEAIDFAESDVHEDFKPVEHWHSEIVWKGW